VQQFSFWNSWAGTLLFEKPSVSGRGRTDGRFYYNVCKRKIVYEKKCLKNHFRKLQVIFGQSFFCPKISI
ncbi:MAG: hypothetical protein ACLR4M_05220, partial [Blautia sp.]